MSARRTPSAGQQGFALVPAVFLIVVLAAVAAFALRLYSGQQQTVVLSLEGARALAAARAGAEWGARRALDGSCGAGTLALNEAALAGYTVVVGCTAATVVEQGTPLNQYVIDAVATRGAYGTPDFVSRRVRLSVGDLP